MNELFINSPLPRSYQAARQLLFFGFTISIEFQYYLFIFIYLSIFFYFFFLRGGGGGGVIKKNIFGGMKILFIYLGDHHKI